MQGTGRLRTESLALPWGGVVVLGRQGCGGSEHCRKGGISSVGQEGAGAGGRYLPAEGKHVQKHRALNQHGRVMTPTNRPSPELDHRREAGH